jgi:transcriptional regulator with XRE-family HTH domain
VQRANPETVFAARLREAREAAGMSQAQLAAEVGERHGIQMDPVTVLRMEKGRRRITLNEAVAVAAVLNIRLYDLLLPLPAEILEMNPARVRERAARLTAVLEQLDADIATAETDAAQSRARAGELRRRRNEVQVELATLAAAPGFTATGVETISARFRGQHEAGESGGSDEPR